MVKLCRWVHPECAVVGALEEKTVCVLCREAMPEAPAEAPATVAQEEEEKTEAEVPMELGRCCSRALCFLGFLSGFSCTLVKI